MPMLVLLREQRRHARSRPLPARIAISPTTSARPTIREWKTLPIDDTTGEIVAPNGAIGFRWNEAAHDDGAKVGRWNLELKDGGSGRAIDPRLSLVKDRRA